MKFIYHNLLNWKEQYENTTSNMKVFCQFLHKEWKDFNCNCSWLCSPESAYSASCKYNHYQNNFCWKFNWYNSNLVSSKINKGPRLWKEHWFVNITITTEDSCLLFLFEKSGMAWKLSGLGVRKPQN